MTEFLLTVLFLDYEVMRLSICTGWLLSVNALAIDWYG
jgi:hypothetical protein